MKMSKITSSGYFDYYTPRLVRIRGKRGLTLNCVRLILYIVGLSVIIGGFVIRKGEHLKEDTGEFIVTIKHDGVAFVNLTATFNVSDDTPNRAYVDNRIWDVADYVVPPQQHDGTFVITNMIIIPRQNLSLCDEDPLVDGNLCDLTSDKEWKKDCPPGSTVPHGNGVRTGVCVNSTQQPGVGVCQVEAWCPVKNLQLPIKGKAVLQTSKDFAMIIKTKVYFPYFNKTRDNIVNGITDLTNCSYDPDDPKDKYCPRFTLGKIVELAGDNYDDISVKGGTIAVNIDWDCNLHYDISRCLPRYSFVRTDQKESQVAPGWNVRFAHYTTEPDGTEVRRLTRAYGIRFTVIVTARATRWEFQVMLEAVGSYLSYLVLVEFILIAVRFFWFECCWKDEYTDVMYKPFPKFSEEELQILAK